MESFSTRERREQAIKAATKIAATYNIKSNEPILLKDSNNTVIHLAPSPVVAKVATSTIRKQTISNKLTTRGKPEAAGFRRRCGLQALTQKGSNFL